MAAYSNVLYALEHSIEPLGFEVLCIDLLTREGYSRIVPGGGTRDHGRDAELRYWTGEKDGRPEMAFQFSLEKKWEAKLRKDFSKISVKCDSFRKLIFVTNRSVTIEKQDKLKSEFWESHQIHLEIFERGWFRVRLEEQHQDLALKHLGLKLEPTPGFSAGQVALLGLDDENKVEILRHTSIATLKATFSSQVVAQPSNIDAWKGLAHVEYCEGNYPLSLRAIGKAMELTEDPCKISNLNYFKATVLAEQGILQGSKRILLDAKTLMFPFLQLGRSIDHYNFANILSALEEWPEAEAHYRKCIGISPLYARAWHNLGTVLVKCNRRKEGLSAYEEALRLNPNLVEALCTKGNLLVMTEGKSAEALSCLEQALVIDPDIGLRWIHSHYWHSMALCQESRFPEALVVAERGLELRPDCPYLLHLIGDIFSKLWREDSTFRKKAEDFFITGIRAHSCDYRSLVELLEILKSNERGAEAWIYLDEIWGSGKVSVRVIADRSEISLASILESLRLIQDYRDYRKCSQLIDYGNLLDQSGFTPNEAIPNLLYHLLMVAFSKLFWGFKDGAAEDAVEVRKRALFECLNLTIRVFGSMGGWILAESPPVKIRDKSDLLARGLVVLNDLALVETSRQFGFISGRFGEIVDPVLEQALVDEYVDKSGRLIEVFLPAVWSDWNLEEDRKAP